MLPADLDVTGADRSVRPNAVLALGLCPDLLPEAAARQVLSRAHRDLVTPVGLRTLSPRDPRYVGQYAGDAAKRDQAYHQGSAWPFLVGAWVDAELALASDRRETARALAPVVLSAAQASQALGQVSELCDGDGPHAPGGAVASAISVAELLRAARALLRVLAP